MVKLLLWVLGGFGIVCLAFWIIASQQLPPTPLVLSVSFVVFGVPPIGSFWMLYMAIRHEKNPWPLMFLAFVPFAFLWYYIERVRTGKHMSRDSSEPGNRETS